MKRCDICLEETCKGEFNCHCEDCKLVNECYRILHPTIRITNKCTQECAHCCFESSPKSNLFMTPETAEKIHKFLVSNEIGWLNLMGGEFFCNPDWYEVLTTLSDGMFHTRLVTNGDWVGSEDVKTKLRKFIKEQGKRLLVSVSKDKWHTNWGVESAIEFLMDCKANFNTPEPSEVSEDSIVPVGRGEIQYSPYYSAWGCACHKDSEKYGFLIDEGGSIYKCPFGVIKYSHIEDHLEGGFAKRFKEFNKRFYSVFVPSCRKCYTTFRYYGGDESKVVGRGY